MSVNYAAGLSYYDNKGVCGLPEILDVPQEAEEKVRKLATLLKESNHTVVIVGAGISTSAGIPDFRGPNGVWTLEKKAQQPKKKLKTERKLTDENEEKTEIKEIKKDDISLADAQPTISHLALKSLVEHRFVKFIISQNIDGLFLKTGIRRENLSEVHGNFYLDECSQCFSRFIRSTPSLTMGLKVSNVKCPRQTGKPCRGYLRDTILDWEDELPYSELKSAEDNILKSDLCICMGTTLQINPVGQMPFWSRKKNPRKVVIINLQKTRHDSKADLVIHEYVDRVSQMICQFLRIPIGTPQDLTDIKPGNQINIWK